MSTTEKSLGLSSTHRVVAGMTAVAATIVWTHGLAGLLGRAPSSSGALTVAAVVAALVGAVVYPRRVSAGVAAAVAGLAGAGVIAWSYPGAFLPSLALIPAAASMAAGGAWLSARLPESLAEQATRRPAWAALWLLLSLVAVVQVGRLATYMTDPETDWFLSTRHPFYAKHECFSAYIYGAELGQRGESNIYDPAHYPGLNPEAKPQTEIQGMTPEDPFQYAPQFLLWPRLAIELTHDYHAIRMLWFGINITLSIGAVIALSLWVGGRIGAHSALLSPLLLASFPVLHNFQYGQFHFAAIALAVLGLLAFSRKRPALGGMLLAVSILSKLFPLFLLVPMAVQRRWRQLIWTAAAGLAITAVAFGVLGPEPFTAFVNYHVARLSDGQAFAFGEAWPEMAALVTAGNQGIHGITYKLAGMGVPGIDNATATGATRVFTIALLALSVYVGVRTAGATRATRAATWLGLLGLTSLASAGAWADYVPLTCIWLLALLAPMLALEPGRLGVKLALAICAVMQFFLLGTMPLGGRAEAAWMYPVSFVGAMALLVTFGSVVLMRLPVAAPERP
jgi:hypothetical protein